MKVAVFGVLGTTVLAGALVGSTHGCSSSGTPGVGGDASPPREDAGAPKSDANAADANAIRDAEVDSGPSGEIELKGEWKQIPGIESKSCLYAVDPAKSVPPLTWEGCPGVNDCERLRVTWTPYRNNIYFEAQEAVMRFGGKPYLMTQRSYPKYQGDMGRVTMFEAEDFQGNVAFAVASYLGDTNLPTTCSGVTASMGTSSIAILTFLKAEVNAADQAARIAFAPFGQPNQIDSAKVTASMMGGKPHSVAQAGDANRVLISNSASSLGMLDTVSKTIVAPVSGYSVMYAPRPIVGGAIVLDGSGIAGIGFLANDNSLTNIYRPANAQVMSVYLDRSDADRLVWAEGRDVAGAAHFSYWTAPLVKAPNAIQPRKITDFEDTSGSYGGYMAVNQGLIVNAARFDRVLITRISDGWSWAISTPPSEYATRALWVDDDYVWIGRGHAVQSGLPEQGLNLDGMFRFSRKNLGNPTIPPS